VDGKCADLWAAFRAWCAETFGSPEDMVVQLRGSLVELGPSETWKRWANPLFSTTPIWELGWFYMFYDWTSYFCLGLDNTKWMIW